MKKGKICHFWAVPQSATSTRTGVVPVPPYSDQIVPVPKKSGTGTTHQNGFGTGTYASGTGTTASYCPDFGIHASLSSNSHTEGIGTLIND